MIISVKKLARNLQMFVWVCLFSFILIKMLQVIHVWIQPTDPYRQPQGDSLKVDVSVYAHAGDPIWLSQLSQRLRQFYFSGE